MCRKHPAQGAFGNDHLDPVPLEAAEVCVLNGPVSAAVLDDPSPDGVRHPRAQPVGAHDESRVDHHSGTGAVLPVHADGPTGVVQPYPGYGDTEPNVDAGLNGSLGDDGVQDLT